MQKVNSSTGMCVDPAFGGQFGRILDVYATTRNDESDARYVGDARDG